MISAELASARHPVATAGNDHTSAMCRPTTALGVLFVDDDAFVIAAMRRMLRCLQDSCEFAFCQGGADALRCLEHQLFDLVISDLQMPGMNGSELLQRISAEYPSVVRFALSGQSDPDRDTPISAVAHRFLPKPCEPTRLRNTIEQLAAVRTQMALAEDLKSCTSLSALPVSPLALEAVQQFCQHRHEQGLLREIDRDLGASMMVLRLANFAAAEPVFALPSEQVATLRGPTLQQLRDWSTLTWPTPQTDHLHSLQAEFSQAVDRQPGTAHWYQAAHTFLPRLLSVSLGWLPDHGPEPRWRSCADYLFVLWTGRTANNRDSGSLGYFGWRSLSVFCQPRMRCNASSGGVSSIRKVRISSNSGCSSQSNNSICTWPR